MDDLHKCPEHLEEDLNYFCDDCCSGAICSECVVHGIHKTHRVHTIKSAYTLIKDRIEVRATDCANAIQKLTGQEEQLALQKEQVVGSGNNVRGQIEAAFSDIAQILNKKKEAVYRDLDRVIGTDLVELEGKQKTISDKREEFASYREVLRDELQLNDPV